MTRMNKFLEIVLGILLFIIVGVFITVFIAWFEGSICEFRRVNGIEYNVKQCESPIRIFKGLGGSMTVDKSNELP